MKKIPPAKEEDKKRDKANLTTPQKKIGKSKHKQPPRHRRGKHVFTPNERKRLDKIARKFGEIHRQLARAEEELERRESKPVKQVASGASQLRQPKEHQIDAEKDKSVTQQETQKALICEFNSFFQILHQRQNKHGLQPCSRYVPRFI